jgi:hypothetical protein
MKVGVISLMTAFLLALPLAAFAGTDPCDPDVDTDGDTICDLVDNCPTKANVGQADADTDNVGDVCDNCINLTQVSGGSPDFCDVDSDGYGDACDGDLDTGGSVNAVDFNNLFLPDFIAGFPTPGVASDMDCGGTVNAVDFNTYFVPKFVAGTPGPSGWSCAGVVPCLVP